MFIDCLEFFWVEGVISIESGNVFEDVLGAEHFGLFEIHFSFRMVVECGRKDSFCNLGHPLFQQLFVVVCFFGEGRRGHKHFFVPGFYIKVVILFVVVSFCGLSYEYFHELY